MVLANGEQIDHTSGLTALRTRELDQLPVCPAFRLSDQPFRHRRRPLGRICRLTGWQPSSSHEFSRNRVTAPLRRADLLVDVSTNSQACIATHLLRLHSLICSFRRNRTNFPAEDLQSTVSLLTNHLVCADGEKLQTENW